MLNILKTIDIFGSSIQLSFRHEYQHKTCCGGIFTVFLVLIFCSSFWILDSSFPIAFGLRQKQSLKYLNQEQYGFSFSVFVQSTSKTNEILNVLETQVILQECSTIQSAESSEIQSQFLSFLSTKDVTNLFCLNTHDAQLKASNLETSKVIVKLNACSTTSIDCLQNYFSLEELVMEAVFVDHIQSFTNYEHPLKGYVKTITASPSAGLKKILSLVFSEVQIFTDDSYAFNESSMSVVSNLAFQTQSLDFNTVQNTETNPVILEMRLEIDYHQISYLRTYKKLSNVLAEIGGLSKVLMFIFALVVVPFAKLDFQTSLMNEIFYFEDENNQNQQEKNSTQYFQESPKSLNPKPRNELYPARQNIKKEEQLNFNIKLKSTQGKPICLQLPERITKLQKKGKADKEPEMNQVYQNQEQIKEEKGEQHTEQLKENKVKAIKSQEIEDTNQHSLENKENPNSYISKGSPIIGKGKKKDSEIIDEQFISQMLHTYSANQDPDSAKLRKKKTLRNLGNSYFKAIFSPKSGGLIFKAYEYVLYYLFPLGEIKKKKRQLEFSLEKISDKLDAVFLINKLLEIDKLKMLMLTEDQLKLFDYMPKPVINNTTCLLGELHPDITNPNFHFRRQTIKLKPTQFPQKPTLDWSLLHQEKTTLMKAHEAYTAFNKIKDSKADISIIDHKLISTLCPKILNYFESTRKQAHFDAQLDMKQQQIFDDKKEKNDQQFFNNVTQNQERNTNCLDEFSSLEENTSEMPFKQREDSSPDKTQMKMQQFEEVASESFFRNKLVLTDFSPTKNRMISSGTQ